MKTFLGRPTLPNFVLLQIFLTLRDAKYGIKINKLKMLLLLKFRLKNLGSVVVANPRIM